MQPKKLKQFLLPLAVATAMSSTSLMAATANYSVGFTTVPDITITQVQAMSFGSFLGLTNGATCTMTVTDSGTAATYPGDSVLRVARAVPAGPGADVAKLTSCGSAPATATGTVGIYEIQGIAGGSVVVTVGNVTGGTDFNYTAGGCVATFDGAGDGDSCLALTGGTPTGAGLVKLASAADTVGNTGGANSGNPTPGAARIAVGGTITATATHTAGQTLTQSFAITVTY